MKTIHFRLHPLAAGAIALLCGAAGPVLAQMPAPAGAEATAATPPAVIVTGSRIARASLEGPSAVTVITGEDITRQGYRNVFDALNNQVQNSGFTQGGDFGNTFTPSANTISLRGLGPNHTLVLLNGRRMADFPIAYDGSVNFTNLANIPSSVVERIEILSGGASAVYGSDAIAGVVNIILKRQADGFDINLKAGGTSRGGAADQRVQLTGGRNFGQLSTLFSLELSERDPLWSKDRPFMASKTGVAPTNTLSRKNLDTGKYVDLGDACANLSGLFGGSEIKYTARAGTYCASPKAGPTFWTTQTRNSSQNFFGSANYALSPETTLFGELLFGQNKTSNNTRGPSWTSASLTDGYFYNQNSQAYETWTKFISPEEIGGAQRYNRTWNDQAASLSFGAKGPLAGGWTYEAGYTASQYTSKSHQQRALAGIDRFFLGPKLGTDADGIAIYAPDPARLTRRLTPEEFNGITGTANSHDKSWTNTASVVTSGEAFTLPAGAVKLATVAELGKQGFSTEPDPRYNQGYFNAAGSDVTAGTRSRYALGAEAEIPLVRTLNATLAGRYDRYSFAGRHDGKATYNGGLEWRPAKPLLLRATYGTSFRAPDMNYIFKARGTGYYSSTTDYYRCAQAGQSIDDCEFANVSPGSDFVTTGSKELRSEKGRSSGLGLVWSPSADFDVTLDYWNIHIDDLVTDLDPDKLLRDEADCRLGKADISSPTCADTLRRIVRYAPNAVFKPGEIRQILVNPINAAYQSTDGIDISAKYVLRAASRGTFIVKGNYSRTLSKRSRQFAGDPLRDDLEDLSNQDWRDKLNASLTWNLDQWSNTLFVQRYGKTANAAQTGLLSPTTLVNVSSVYRLNQRTTLSVAVNNLFNKVKTDTSGGWPFYPVGNYSPIGRQGWVELNYHFGS